MKNVVIEKQKTIIVKDIYFRSKLWQKNCLK